MNLPYILVASVSKCHHTNLKAMCCRKLPPGSKNESFLKNKRTIFDTVSANHGCYISKGFRFQKVLCESTNCFHGCVLSVRLIIGCFFARAIHGWVRPAIMMSSYYIVKHNFGASRGPLEATFRRKSSKLLAF